MNEEKKVTKKEYPAQFGGAAASVCISVPAVLGVYHFFKDGTGDLSESADFFSPYSESEVLCGP